MKNLINRWWIASVCCALLALLPFIIISFRNGGVPGVMPDFIDDATYYTSRIHQVSDGYIFIGNPYYLEHRSEMSAAFFVADWFGAVPVILGLPLSYGLMFNVAFWSFLGVSLLFCFLRRGGLSSKECALISVGIFVTLYWMFIRPVSMQIVYPFFLVFLITLYDWIAEPMSKRRSLYLILISSATFYIYTYLWQVVAVTLFIVGGCSLLSRYRQYRQGIINGIFTVVLALPMVYYTYLQLQHPHYWETVERIGLVLTHSFDGVAVWYGILIISCLYCARLIFDRQSPGNFFWSVTGAGLMIAIFSNVITGKDLETSVHVGRFVDLWVLLFWAVNYKALLLRVCRIGAYTRDIIQSPTIQQKIRMCVRMGVALCIILLTVNFFFKVYSSNIRNAIYAATVPITHEYGPMLTWLKTHTPKDSVVLTTDKLSTMVTLITSSYPVFHPNGELYLMSSDEVIERYLVSRMGNIDITKIKQDMRLYAGAGNTEHQFRAHNRVVTLCKWLLLEKIGVMCGEYVTSISFKGENYFNNIYQKYLALMQDQKTSLHRYGVSYIITDKLDKQFDIHVPYERVYSDSRFEIDRIL